MPCVDIVIPLYNKAGCIERAIESIRAQTMTDWRLIVVDDGSTDGGADIVRAITDERIELIQQKNAGPGAARNAGIEKAKSKYIAFLDADDEWYKWYLKNAIDAIEREDGISVVSTMYYEWPAKQDMTKHWAKHKVYEGRYSLDASCNPGRADWLLSYLHVGNSLLLTEVAKKYDGFYDADKCLCGEDTVFFMRIGINEDFLIIGPPAVRHHREDSGLSNFLRQELPPFLTKPETVLSYCPAEKKELMKKVLDHMALRRAHILARHGYKADAAGLLEQFNGAKAFKWKYYQCRTIMLLSRWYPYWVKFKCAVGPPVRLSLKNMGAKLGLFPDIPEVNRAKKQ